MELKLVYRGLRQVSDWALRFYSEVYVDGQENVPRDGPLIIVSCHHNEILDIATLSVAIPHRRPVCFWAKSTLFKNPVVRQILLSSGSIPVARNPNNAVLPSEKEGTSSNLNAINALFRETFSALERDEVIGVFPEGTSYTEPSIAQVKDGASRAALEYVRWLGESKNGKAKAKEKKLLIVPVGIVYTDKSRYQSKLCVRWGKPIDVEAFAEEQLSAHQESASVVDSREVVRALTGEIEKRMLELTINAPDWDTLYVAQTARDILWADEDIPLSQFVSISQNLVDLFADHEAAASCAKAQHSLLKYHSLLYYTGLSHRSLTAVLPLSSSTTTPSRLGALLSVTRELLISVLHPRFILFFPVFVRHVPAYIAGYLADLVFGKKDEEETRAQFKAVFGGLAATAAYAAVTRQIVRGLVSGSINAFFRTRFGNGTVDNFLANGQRLLTAGDGWAGKTRAALGMFGIFYATSYVLSHWHNYWVGSNFTQLRRLVASLKVFLGVCIPQSRALSGNELAPYTVPYIPPPNPFIKRRAPTSELRPNSEVSKPPHVMVPRVRLVRPLLEARAEATRNLWSFMADSKYLGGSVTTRAKGEGWMQVGPAKR